MHLAPWKVRLCCPPFSCWATGPSNPLRGWCLGTGEPLTQSGVLTRGGCRSGGRALQARVGLLTDMSGGDAEGLDQQGLLPSFRDAIQNPALGREGGKVLTYVYFSRCFWNYYKRNIIPL